MAIPDDIAPETSKKEQPEDPFKSLVEWSKWLITINFAAATGCVITLQGAVGNPDAGQWLLIAMMSAIIFFCASVGFSVQLIYELSKEKIFDKYLSNASVDQDQTKKRDRYLSIAQKQFVSFTLALAMLCIWVAIKVYTRPTPKPKAESCCCMCK